MLCWKRNQYFIQKVLIFVTSLLTLASTVQASDIKKIEPDQLIAYIKAQSHDKPLVVHFSSSDKNCDHCQANNKRLREAQQSLGNVFNFVELEFNPWRSFWKRKDLIKAYRAKKINIRGLPATRVIYKEHVMAAIEGNVTTLVDDIRASQDLNAILDNPKLAAGKAIPVVLSQSLPDYIKANSKKPLLIHFTSTDGSSIHSERSNAFMKRAYNNLNEQFNFVEVIFNPWDKVKSKKALLKKYKIKGLPHIAIYHNNKPVSYQGGVNPSLEKGLVEYANKLKK